MTPSARTGGIGRTDERTDELARCGRARVRRGLSGCAEQAPRRVGLKTAETEKIEPTADARVADAIAEIPEERPADPAQEAPETPADPPATAPEVPPMSEREILRLFHVVEHDRGRRYVQARDRLVEQGERIRPFLEGHLHDPDWMRVQAADVLLGWIDHREEYQRCSDYLTRRLEVPGDGTPTSGDTRAPEVIRGMYPTIVPRLIELLLKTDEVPSDPIWHGAFINSLAGADGRFREPFAAIMNDPSKSMHDRIAFAGDLISRFQDARAIEFAHRLAWDSGAAIDDRWAGFSMLADAGRADELPRIRQHLGDRHASERTLELFVRAAASFRDHESLDTLLGLLRRARTPSLRFEVLVALAFLRDPRAIPEVERTRVSDPDDSVRDRAFDTLIALRGSPPIP